MKDYAFVVYYSEEDEGWVATLPDLKYCSVVEDDPEEAVKQLMIAKDLWLASAHSHGDPIPAPTYHPVLHPLAS